jgi:hypothetical protein
LHWGYCKFSVSEGRNADEASRPISTLLVSLYVAWLALDKIEGFLVLQEDRYRVSSFNNSNYKPYLKGTTGLLYLSRESSIQLSSPGLLVKL